MKIEFCLKLVLLWSSLVLSQLAWAETINENDFLETIFGAETQPELYVRASIGVLAETNVTFQSLDNNADGSDVAATSRGIATFKIDALTNITSRTSYAFRTQSYNDETDFDLFGHSLEQQFYGFLGANRVGVSTLVSQFELGGDEALKSWSFNPFISRKVSQNGLIKLSAIYADNRFPTARERDGETKSLKFDYGHRLGERTRLGGSYRYIRADTQNDSFAYGGHRLDVYASQIHHLLGKDLRLSIQGRFEDRSYDGITPSIAARRDEERWRVGSSVLIPLRDKVALNLRYEHRNNMSNIDSLSYDNTIVEARLGLRF